MRRCVSKPIIKSTMSLREEQIKELRLQIDAARSKNHMTVGSCNKFLAAVNTCNRKYGKIPPSMIRRLFGKSKSVVDDKTFNDELHKIHLQYFQNASDNVFI